MFATSRDTNIDLLKTIVSNIITSKCNNIICFYSTRRAAIPNKSLTMILHLWSTHMEQNYTQALFSRNYIVMLFSTWRTVPIPTFRTVVKPTLDTRTPVDFAQCMFALNARYHTILTGVMITNCTCCPVGKTIHSVVARRALFFVIITAFTHIHVACSAPLNNGKFFTHVTGSHVFFDNIDKIVMSLFTRVARGDA